MPFHIFKQLRHWHNGLSKLLSEICQSKHFTCLSRGFISTINSRGIHLVLKTATYIYLSFPRSVCRYKIREETTLGNSIQQEVVSPHFSISSVPVICVLCMCGRHLLQHLQSSPSPTPLTGWGRETQGLSSHGLVVGPEWKVGIGILR